MMPEQIGQQPGGGAAPAPNITITQVADQDTDADVSLSLGTVELDGVDRSGDVTAYSWTVNGATTGLDDATSATPTFTPPALVGAVYTVACTVTIGGEDYDSAPETFRVGGATLLGTAAMEAIMRRHDAPWWGVGALVVLSAGSGLVYAGAALVRAVTA